MLQNKKIVVLAGGRSREREVSLSSAQSVMKAMEELGLHALQLDATHNLVEDLQAAKPDIVFNCLHGTFGEDGTVPGILEFLQIPYTHSGILASSICFNKMRTNQILKTYGVPMAPSVVVDLETLRDAFINGEHLMDTSYVIKPLCEGSTVGIFIVKTPDDLPDLSGWEYGDRVMLEKYIPGKELTCTVFNNEALVVTELRPLSGFYDYESKYTQGRTEHILPAEIPDNITALCKKFALLAHKKLGVRTLSRSDFRYDPAQGDQGLYFLEINTHPGFTSLSLAPEAARYRGIEFKQMVEKLLIDATLDIKCP